MKSPGLTNYRPEIDILRAVAVLPVILFHFGYLKNGYLGVDIFFVISGYLITGILYKELTTDRFSMIQFYLRRIRRIIPLMLFVCLVTLIAGMIFMLPDDLENLCQSVIATVFFSNNILLWLTSHNYWNLINDFKPLMHTWSLGVEEQFYLLFPFIFFFFRGERRRLIVPVLILLALVSLTLFLSAADGGSKFYLIQYRFFELAVGGITALLPLKKITANFLQPLLMMIIIVMICLPAPLAADLKLLVTVLLSAAFLYLSGQKDPHPVFARNPVGIFLGKISFSLYMWHQPVLAFTRYVFSWQINGILTVILLLIIFLLSVFSFYCIEQPFRNRKQVSTRVLVTGSAALAISIAFVSLYIYAVDGVIRDVPELNQYRSEAKFKLSRKNETNINYNSRVYEMNKPFSPGKKIRVLVVGDSFARDWANVLLAMPYANRLDLSYCVLLPDIADAQQRLDEAEYIFFSELSHNGFDSLCRQYRIDESKVWNVGTKSFGVQNGVFYNQRNRSGYCDLHTEIHSYFLQKNSEQKQQWKQRYIDLIGMVADTNWHMPVFTPDCKFISEDGHHLTIPGALFFAQKLEEKKWLPLGK